MGKFFSPNCILVRQNLRSEDDFGSNNSSRERAHRDPKQDKAKDPFIGARRASYVQNIKKSIKHENIGEVLISGCFHVYKILLKM